MELGVELSRLLNRQLREQDNMLTEIEKLKKEPSALYGLSESMRRLENMACHTVFL